jgi:hypothetical protein
LGFEVGTQGVWQTVDAGGAADSSEGDWSASDDSALTGETFPLPAPLHQIVLQVFAAKLAEKSECWPRPSRWDYFCWDSGELYHAPLSFIPLTPPSKRKKPISFLIIFQTGFVLDVEVI